MTRLETLYSIISVMENPQNLDLNEWSTCFAGEACVDPRFQDQGLFMNDEGVPAFSTTKDNFEGFEALAVFFGLLPREAFYLFAMCEYERHSMAGDVHTLSIHDTFLCRLAGIIQQRKDNHGHPPKR